MSRTHSPLALIPMPNLWGPNLWVPHCVWPSPQGLTPQVTALSQPFPWTMVSPWIKSCAGLHRLQPVPVALAVVSGSLAHAPLVLASSLLMLSRALTPLPLDPGVPVHMPLPSKLAYHIQDTPLSPPRLPSLCCCLLPSPLSPRSVVIIAKQPNQSP